MACVCAKLLQSCPALCNPVDYSPLGSSVHGILQARILEWVAMPSFGWSSQPRDQTCVSWSSEPPGKPDGKCIRVLFCFYIVQVGLWVSHEASHFSSGSLGIWSHQLPGRSWKKEEETYMIKTHQWDKQSRKLHAVPRGPEWHNGSALSVSAPSTQYWEVQWTQSWMCEWTSGTEADMTSEKGLGQLSPKGMMRTLAQQDPLSEVQSKWLVWFF